MHHYPFHPGDYMLDTAHLEPMEDLAYRRLLDLYYSSEKPISTETELVSRRLRLGSELVNRVLKEFFELTENGWKHARCDAEIANYKARAEVAKKNGKLGGRPKKTDSVNLANPGETNSKANQEPRTKNQNQNQEPSNSPVVPKGTGWRPTAEQLRVASWFGRRETTRWSDKELKSWRAIVASLDASDLDALERRYTSNDPETVKYRRHDLATLLNNWPGEVDKARRWTPPQVSNVTAKNSTDETPWFEKPEPPLNP